MKTSNLSFLLLTFVALFAAGCSDDWVWEPGPGPVTSLSGTVILMDSTNRNPLPIDRSGVSVLLITENYPYTVLDSTMTDKNGYWKMSNVPSGYETIVMLKPGFSAAEVDVQMPLPEVYRTDTLQSWSLESLGAAMQHSVILDSSGLDYYPHDTAYTILGHDPLMGQRTFWNILLCCDSARNVPSYGTHLGETIITWVDLGGPPRDFNTFWGEPGVGPSSFPNADTLYFVAYAINPIEGEIPPYNNYPNASGYRTCGPPSNVIAIPRK